MAMLCMLSTDVALAQTKKRARKPTASVTKTTPPKRQDDVEYKRLVHERDSLEALRDDLLGRKNLSILKSQTAKDGIEYQIFVVKGFDNGKGRLFLRMKNPNNVANKILKVSIFYDNGNKYEVLGWTVTAPLGIWGNGSCGIDIKGNPIPETIKNLEIEYKNSIWDNYYVKNDKILFKNLEIEYDD